MTELETLRAFFKAYEAVQALPKTGRPGPERKAAQEELEMRARAVRDWKASFTVSTPSQIADAATEIVSSQQEFRALQQQVAAIPPKDTRGEPAKKVTVVS